jgi:hypothetical protein
VVRSGGELRGWSTRVGVQDDRYSLLPRFLAGSESLIIDLGLDWGCTPDSPGLSCCEWW